MKPKLPIRIILALLLAVASIGPILNIFRVLIGPSDFASFLSDVSFLANFASFLGSISLIVFVALLVVDLLGKKFISKVAYAISIIIGIIALAVTLLLGYGLVQDAFGGYCSGFFGAQTRCIYLPMLLISMTVLHPYALTALGLAAVCGIATQFKARKQTLPKTK